MSFIQNSANYSQTNLLKSKILTPLLNMYNNFLLNENKLYLEKDVLTGESCDFIIPNNNRKYYLLITKKSDIESFSNNSNDYNILYFLIIFIII